MDCFFNKQVVKTVIGKCLPIAFDGHHYLMITLQSFFFAYLFSAFSQVWELITKSVAHLSKISPIFLAISLFLAASRNCRPLVPDRWIATPGEAGEEWLWGCEQRLQ